MKNKVKLILWLLDFTNFLFYMTGKKKKSFKRRKKVVSSPGKIWLILIVIGAFYFFIKTYAPESPLIYLTYITEFFFWRLWNNFFYSILILLWVMLILYPQNWRERFLLYSFVTFIFLLSILSFPLLDGWDQDAILANGWYVWWWLIQAIAFLMWGSVISTKIFSVILFILTFIFTSWRLKLYLLIPKIEFEVPEKEVKRKTVKIKKPLKNNSKTDFLANENKEYEKDKNFIKQIFKNKIENKIKEKKEEKNTKIIYPKDKPTFSIENLKTESEDYDIDENILIEQANDIKTKLDEFNIPVDIAWYEVWPTIIQFKIKPAKGIKVSSIENMKKDISLSLKSSIRILTPIPWTEYVGIEMPNPRSKIVHLWQVLWSKDFTKSMNKNLTNLAIWKNINWKNFINSLESMPHLLVAWQTGSWKSVAINDYIISLLYQNTPDELKFIMIDPKQVELWLYEWLPYLLAPIINEPEKALKVLKWSVDLMNKRYKLLKDNRVKNIYEYNQKVDEKDKMSRIVIVVDELADLMMSWNKKEVEHNIARIAQMARAVWMHLILATQRPSVNVITWLIKANIPTRIAFGVVSWVDSRTILDRQWAEDLLWKWDLLFVSPSYKHPIRAQAPFIDTDDIEDIVSSLKQKYLKNIDEENIYDSELMDILSWNSSESSYDSSNISWDDEELIKQAIEIIQQTRKASITLLQRRLKIWFARAARLMDQLEEKWIVWPQEWSKPRDILI